MAENNDLSKGVRYFVENYDFSKGVRYFWAESDDFSKGVLYFWCENIGFSKAVRSFLLKNISFKGFRYFYVKSVFCFRRWVVMLAIMLGPAQALLN